MKVEQKGHTILIKDTEGDSGIFLQKIEGQYPTFKNSNLILDITHDKSVNMDAIKNFIDLSNKHISAKKSFVIVADGINFDEVPSTIIVVPTVLEAHDIIEMEEIERDLGF